MGMNKLRRTTQVNGPLTVGHSGTGYDVTLYGNTSGAYATWDASADEVVWTGNSQYYQYLWLGANAWDVSNASAVNTNGWQGLYRQIDMTAVVAASGNVDVYAAPLAIANINTAACLSASVFWSVAASVANDAAQVQLFWKHYADGEATAGTTGSTAAMKVSCTCAATCSLNISEMTTSIDPPASDDLMGLTFRYHSAGSSTTGSDFRFHGLRLRYVAN